MHLLELGTIIPTTDRDTISQTLLHFIKILTILPMKEPHTFEPDKWIYTLPDGTEKTNMLDARRQLNASKVRFVGMLKSGYVTRRKRQ